MKILYKSIATSIICNEGLLMRNPGLELVGENRENKYYSVKGTNTVIMHVEDDFCILVDYMVAKRDVGMIVSLPQKLSEKHYGVYQSGKTSRDWVKNTVSHNLIGYEIKEIIYGPNHKKYNETYDHEDATFDERDKVTRFTTCNVNHGSHRCKIDINSQNVLNRFIRQIINNDKSSKGMYILPKKKK